MDRHTTGGPDAFEVTFFEERSIDDFYPFIGIHAELLTRATQLIHEFLDSPVAEQIKKLRSEVDRVRLDLETSGD